jgi:hypothetical protein
MLQFKPQAIDDGLMEVVGVRSSFHMVLSLSLYCLYVRVIAYLATGNHHGQSWQRGQARAAPKSGHPLPLQPSFTRPGTQATPASAL